jgi:uncharacterized protein HemX
MEEMQQNVAPQAPAPTPATGPLPVYTESEKKHITGPVVAILIVLVALLLGGLYLWGSMLPEEVVDDTTVPKTTDTANNTPTTPGATTTSDELGDIETDLDVAASGATDGTTEIDAALSTQ